jgi:hypothetical protein
MITPAPSLVPFDDDRDNADLDAAILEREANPPPRFPLVAFADMRPGTEPPYLVRGFIPRVGLIVVWGPPKCGKSFWVFNVAMHVALQRDWHERGVHGGPVVYCAFEGAAGFKKRAEAFRRRFIVDNPDQTVPFFMSPTPMDLVADHRALIDSIAKQLTADPALVVLDTLNRSLRGSESDDKDMGAYIKAADAICGKFNCAVVIVHHCGVDGSRPRGHTSLGGAVDAQLAVKKDSAGNITVSVDWMKDGPEDESETVALELVGLGSDDDGEPITSCVVVPTETAPRASERRLTERQRLALDALDEVLLAGGRPAPNEFGLPGNVKVATLDAWKVEMGRRGIIRADDKNPRATFQRLRDALAARHLIGQRDELVWRAYQQP